MHEGSSPVAGFDSRLAWCYAGNVWFGSGLFFHAFLYNFYLDRLGLKAGVMGRAAALLTAGGLLALLPAGWLVDRYGPRAVLRAAVGLAAMGLTAGAFAVAPLAIALAAGLTGAATAAWRVASAPALLALAGAGLSRARLFGWNVALLVGSGGLWYALAGAIPRWVQPPAATTPSLAGLRWALVAGALGTGLAYLCYGAARIPAPGARAVAPASRALAQRLTNALALPRPALVLAAGAACWMTAPALASPFYNIYFHQRFGLGIDRLGVVFGASHLVTALVVFGSGEAATRLGPHRTLAAWFLAFPGLVVLLGSATASTPALALYLLIGLVSPSTNPLFDQLLFDRVPVERRGLAGSWRNAATEASGAAGAWIGGALVQAASFVTLFSAAGLTSLLGALAVVLALRGPRSPASVPAGGES